MIAAFVLLLLQGAASGAPGRRVIGPGAPGGLAAAVANARPGDTLHLLPGRYRGPVVVDRRLVILAERGAALDGGGRGTVLTLRADSVVVEGLAVTASGRSLDHDDAAIKVDHCVGCRLVRNVVTEPLHGIYLLASSEIEISGNTITGSAALSESARGNGIHLFNSSANLLQGNRIRGTRDGVYFSFAAGNVVRRNDVRGVRYGLHYMYSDDNRFEQNVFAENAAGAAIMFSKRIVLTENVFSRHVGYRAYGILLQTGEGILAERNRIEGNLTGLFLDGSTGNTFRDNQITGNGTGIDLLASAEGNVFSGNILDGNRTAVRKVLGAGENRWELGGRGNFWGDPAVFDLDGDGIGDRSYRVGDPFTSLAAARPSLELFAGTIAARALSWAENAFPVFDVPRVEDPRPIARRPAPPVAETPVIAELGAFPGLRALVAFGALLLLAGAWRLRSRAAA